MFNGRTPVLGKDVDDATKEGIGLTTGTEGNTASAPTAGGRTANPIRSNLIKKLDITGFDNAAPTAGKIQATLGNSANKDIHNALVTQSRDTNGVWTCKVAAETAKGFKNKFIPTGCENGK